jgi:hypothetical protein
VSVVVVIIGLAQCALAENGGKIRYSDSIFAGKYRDAHANPRRRKIMTKSGFDAEFGVVVVGAGSAGCVLAARLTKNPHVS